MVDCNWLSYVYDWCVCVCFLVWVRLFQIGAGWCALRGSGPLLILIGCSNNNYASREKCKKCGQPKEIAAMPAIAMPGPSFPTYAHSFARAHLPPGYRALAGNSALASNQSWPVGGGANYGHHSATGWFFHGSNAGSPQNLNQFSMVPKGWRSGDWLCNCGFHNYSSRMQVLLSVILRLSLYSLLTKRYC